MGKTISVEEQEKEEAKDGKKDGDSWAKLGSTISQFFSGSDGEGDKGEKTEEKKEEEPSAKEDETKTESKEEEEKKEEKKEKTGGEKYDTKKDKKESKDGKDGKDKEKDKKKEPKKPKVETVKAELGMEYRRGDVDNLVGELFDVSKTKLEQLDQADKDRAEHETALNELQSFVFDAQDKLYQEDYEKASTDEEREKIREMCSTTSDWLDEEAGPLTPTT